ncbi:hypothetical protein ACPCG0_12710 [Propionibacteriaceae bacterium Y1923]|uniref:hypothetical protein n=1 Tax=Aestuariimicrobium sp. Y1814 TaxID=3418742 RepID=UPI003C1A0725
MVGHFVRLKVSLIIAGFRTGNLPRIIGSVFGLLLGLAAGVSGLVLGIALRWVPDPWQGLVVHLGLALVLLVWILGPMLIAASDAAMDPVKLTLLPLSKRQLASGLAAAALVGPGGLATVLTMVGLVIGLAARPVDVPLVVIGAVLFTVTCAMVSRLVISLVGLGLRRRGIRDVLAVAVPLVVVLLSQLPNLISQFAVHQGAAAAEHVLAQVARVTRFLPSSFSAEVLLAGHDGRWLRGLVELAGGLALVALVGWLWSLVLTRVMTSPPASGGSDRSTRALKLPFAPVLARLRPRVRGVAAKDIILMFRDPTQRVGVIILVVFGLAAIVVPAVLLRDLPAASFIVAAVAWILGLTYTNMYGYDGSSHWVNVAAGDDARSDLLGKLVARLLVYTPVLALMAVALPLVIEPKLVVSVLGITLGVWFVSIGLGVLQSVIAPYPVAQSEDSLMATNTGTFTAFVAQLVAFPVLGVACGPFLAIAMLTLDHPVWPSLAGLGGALVGALVMWGLWAFAVRFSAGRQPELLGQISKRAEA